MTDDKAIDQPDLGMVDVKTVDQFAEYLLRWHSTQLALAQHMLNVPLGTDMEVGEDKIITLEGERLEAFKAGVSTVISIFQDLPFAVSTEEGNDDNRSESDTSGN